MHKRSELFVKIFLGALTQGALLLFVLAATGWPVPASPAQLPAITWAHSGGGAFEDFGWSVAVDNVGNALVAGHFTAPAIFGSTRFDQGALLDIFLAKYSVAGELLWVRSAGGPRDDDARGVAADAGQNVYVTGSFTSPAAFGPFSLQGTGNTDIFLAKYDPAGNVVWMKQAGGSGANEGRGLAVDGTGNIRQTGYFSDMASFGSTNLVSEGLADIFVAKYNASGTLLWARSAGGTNSDEALAIAVDTAGNSFVTGTFNGTAIFDQTTLNSFGGADVFLAKYDPDGRLIWVTHAGGKDAPSADVGYGIAADFEGNVYVTGSIMSTASFDGIALPHAGGGDIFIAKFSRNGAVLWAKSFGGVGPDQGHSIGVDANGDVSVTGFFLGTVAFGSTVLDSPGHADVFVVKLDTSGTLLWALQAGGSAYKSGNGLAVTPAGMSFVTGFFRGTTMFGEFTLTNLFISNRDPFIARVDGPASPPRLGIARAGNEVLLSWPANQTAFKLESAERLLPPANWSLVTNQSSIVNHRRTLTNEPSAPMRLYRLRSP